MVIRIIEESSEDLPYMMGPQCIIDRAKAHIDPLQWERQAVEAFEEARYYEPPHYKYGLGGGNPAGDLSTDGEILYYIKRLDGYRYRRVPIAMHEKGGD